MPVLMETVLMYLDGVGAVISDFGRAIDDKLEMVPTHHAQPSFIYFYIFRLCCKYRSRS